MALLGNVIWFVFGGFIAGILWAIAGVIAFISVIGIPWGRACFMLSNFSFFPFGRAVINRDELSGQGDIGTGKAGTLGNIIWFILLGWWLALAHVIAGVMCCLTIIGIPFGIQHFKLAGAALFPVGKTVVNKHLAEAALKRNAEENLSNIRSGERKTIAMAGGISAQALQEKIRAKASELQTAFNRNPKGIIKIGLAILAVLVIVVGAVKFIGGKKEVPTCSDESTLSLARNIIYKQIGGTGSPSEQEIIKNVRFEQTRATAHLEKIRKYQCEAQLLIADTFQLPIKYDSQRNDKDEHIVTVGYISHRDKTHMKTALEKARRNAEEAQKQAEADKLKAQSENPPASSPSPASAAPPDPTPATSVPAPVVPAQKVEKTKQPAPQEKKRKSPPVKKDTTPVSQNPVENKKSPQKERSSGIFDLIKKIPKGEAPKDDAWKN